MTLFIPYLRQVDKYLRFSEKRAPRLFLRPTRDERNRQADEECVADKAVEERRDGERKWWCSRERRHDISHHEIDRCPVNQSPQYRPLQQHRERETRAVVDCREDECDEEMD